MTSSQYFKDSYDEVNIILFEFKKVQSIIVSFLLSNPCQCKMRRNPQVRNPSPGNFRTDPCRDAPQGHPGIDCLLRDISAWIPEKMKPAATGNTDSN